MFADSVAVDVRLLVQALDSLGVAAKHQKEVAASVAHLDAFDELSRLHARAASFAAPKVDGSDIQTRLAAGAEVTDIELVDYAVRATAAGTKIGPAARGIVRSAQANRARNAREALRTIFPAFIEDLRAVLAAAGQDPEAALINKLNSALSSIDDLAGRGQCDYWCMRNFRDGKWAILEREAAEAREAANHDFVKEQRAKKEHEAANPMRVVVAKKAPTLLRRRPASVSSGFGGVPLTTADVEAYHAEKQPASVVTREVMARELNR